MNEIVIGIDFGTTASKMAVMDEFGRPKIIRNAENEEVTPTYLAFENQSRPIVGREALRMKFTHPQDTLSGFKLQLGTGDVLYKTSAGKKITATDAAAEVLRKLKSDAEQTLGAPVSKCVLTCPANFHDDAKQALLSAAKQAGLDVLKLVPEPSAAALAYGLSCKVRQTIMVPDIGGGTTDVSIARLAQDKVEILGTSGIPNLGGRDFDQALAEHVLAGFETQKGFRPNVKDDPSAIADLSERVEDAKFALSVREKTVISLGARGQYANIELTRKELEDLTAQHRQQITQTCLDLLDYVQLGATDLDRVVLVGGGSKAPGIREALESALHQPPVMSIDPLYAVAYGAAIAAAVEAGGQIINGRAIPAPKVQLKDVTAYAIGCLVKDPYQGERNAVIVPRHAPIPATFTERFRMEYPEQTDVQITLLQGNDGDTPDLCLELGSMTLSELPADPNLPQRIEVPLHFDASGMVTAKGKDLISGKSVEMSVEYRRGMTKK